MKQIKIHPHFSIIYVTGDIKVFAKKFAQRKAFEGMERIRKTGKFRMTDDEIRKARDFGRE